MPDDHLETPHFVEWGVSAEDESFEWRDFRTKQEAADFANHKAAKGYAVWLGEVGSYVTKQGNELQDWIYWWWNSKEDWNEQCDRGGGRPLHAQTQQVSYTPYDKTGWEG